MAAGTAAPGGAAARFVRARVGGLPRPFWVLIAGVVVNRLGFMVQPFLAYYLAVVNGLSVTATGAVISCCGFGMLCSQLVGGALADRIGRRATVAASMATNAVVIALLAVVSGPVALAVVVFFFGFALDLYRPSSAALVADLVGDDDRVRAYGLLYWGTNLGFAASMVLGGALTTIGYGWLFAMDAATCLVFGVLIWRGVPETRHAASPGRAAPGWGLLVALRDRLLVGFAFLVLLQAFVAMQAFTNLPQAMRLDGLSPQSYGIAIAVNGILIVVLQPLIGSLLATRDKSVAMAISTAVFGAGFALTALADAVWGYALSVAVWTVGEVLAAGVPLAVVAALAPAHRRGLYSGVFFLAYSSAWLIAPIGGAWLLERGAATLWIGCGAVCAVSAAGQLVLAPAIRRRQATLEVVDR